MHFHGMAAFLQFLETLISFSMAIFYKNASTHTGFSFAQPPTGREYAGWDG